MTYADIFTVLQIFIPQIKQADQKFTIVLRRKMIFLYAALLFERLQSGDKL